MITETITSISALAVTGFALKSYFTSTRIIWDHQVGLHFKNGKLIEVLAPGKHTFWGKGHLVEVSESRLQELTIQTQEIHTADMISVRISMVVLYRVDDHEKAYLSTSHSANALYTAVQLALRDAVAKINLDDLVFNRSSLAEEIILKAKASAEQLGLAVSEAAIRDIILPGDIKSAQHEAMKAKKQAAAKLEVARGEAAAMRTMANAAKQLESRPEILKMKYLEVLEKAAENGCNTFVVSDGESLPNAIRVN